MQKVYLLLRNNQQTGPHSLEELLQLNLNSTDLVWVEGKSYGWSYPFEVDTLKPFVAKEVEQPSKSSPVQPTHNNNSSTINSPASNKKIFVSMPVDPVRNSVPLTSAPSSFDPIEQKAEELRKKVQSYVPQTPPISEEVKTNYTRSLQDVEEDYTSWMFQKKAKKKKFFSGKYVALTAIVLVGLAGGWWAGTKVFTKPPATQTSKVANLTTQVNTESQSNSTVADANKPPISTTTVETTLPKSPAIHTDVKKSKDKKVIQQVKENNPSPAPPVLVQNDATEPAIEKTTPVSTEANNQPATAELPKEKKRSLKQLFGGLFKKNKNQEQTPEEPRSAANSNSQRTATRRDEQTPPTEVMVDIADQVDVKTNKDADDWMMGVQGLKLTLNNRSPLTLKTALVEVFYYSEQNNLLQKKRINFSNIGARKSQTVSAPDHRLADHIEYKIISATGEENAYVKQ